MNTRSPQLSVVAPCKYYFDDGNESNICILEKGGVLTLSGNEDMPRNTKVEITCNQPLQGVIVLRNTAHKADTLMMCGASTVSNCSDYLELRIEEKARAEIGTLMSLQVINVYVDSIANLHISTLSGDTY